MGLLVALFLHASYHLGLGVVHGQVEGLITGGFLMFVAVILAWLRLAARFSGGPDGKNHLSIRSNWMNGTPA